MSAIPRVLRQGTAPNNLFDGSRPAGDGVLVGQVKQWLNRAQGGLFEPEVAQCYKLARLYANLKDATSFEVRLYLAVSQTSVLLYSEGSEEVDSNVLLVQQPGIILAPGDQIRISATGGTGSHLAEMVLEPLA